VSAHIESALPPIRAMAGDHIGSDGRVNADDEVVGTLIAVAPTAGVVRLVSATAGVALAAGYDLEPAFEGLDASGRGGTDAPVRRA
jgi:hypothetical protein